MLFVRLNILPGAYTGICQEGLLNFPGGRRGGLSNQQPDFLYTPLNHDLPEN